MQQQALASWGGAFALGCSRSQGVVGNSIVGGASSVGGLGAPMGGDLEGLGGDLTAIGGDKVYRGVGCGYVGHSGPLLEPGEGVSGDQSACYGMSVAVGSGGGPEVHGMMMGQPPVGVSLAEPSLNPNPNPNPGSGPLPMSPGISTISLSQQSVGPVNISQSLMTPSTAAPSSSASPVSYSPSSGQSSSGFMGFDCSYPMEGAHKRIRMEPEERLVVDILDDNIMGRELKLGDHHQIVDLDSSKGRRWSNNSTTSTISSSFSLNTSEGGCVVSRPGDGTGRENLGILGHGYQQDKFCSPEELGAQKPKTGEPAYEMGTMEEEHYQMGGQMEGEFFINSDNYLTDEEKLKLRRRGRRRRPGEIEAWKTIIPRTTVDEAEHFVQTSQYRMRHVYRDPRAVSFVYRCVQHVECQYEMRIYLISHETCYVQHRGYHTEEKQKYKRPGLPQHTLPLIDELIRKGLPPKSVIDHAIQIYPEVADQSNISVLYRQITNRQQYIRKRQRNYV